jgi:hypothetical protein
MELDLQELFQRVDLSIQDVKKKTFVQPCRAFVSFIFLTPLGWKQEHDLQHYYNFVPKAPYVDGWHYIVHGHDKWTPCATPHYCHLVGFKPGPEYNPSFRRMFDLKWKDKYL